MTIEQTSAPRAALYLRSSVADDEQVDHQRRALEALAVLKGWRVVEVFVDHGSSSPAGLDQRPGLAKLLHAVAQRQFDVLVTSSLDRLTRSLWKMVMILDTIGAAGVYLHVASSSSDISGAPERPR